MSGKQQCSGLTAKGAQCGRKGDASQAGEDFYCHKHTSQAKNLGSIAKTTIASRAKKQRDKQQKREAHQLSRYPNPKQIQESHSARELQQRLEALNINDEAGEAGEYYGGYRRRRGHSKFDYAF